MSIRILIRVLIFLSIFLGINVFIAWNGQAFLSVAFSVHHFVLYGVIYSFLAFSFLIAMIFRRLLPHRVYVVLRVTGAYGIAIQFYALFLFLMGDIGVWLLHLTGVSLTSAVLWIGFIAAALIIVLMARGSWNARTPVVRRYDLTIRKKAGALRQLRVMVASDLHLGILVGKRQLAKLVKLAEELQPDLILLPGDVLDDSLDPFVKENMADVMKQLRAPFGIFAVLGNHEYYGGHIDEYIKRMKDIGIHVLTDEVVKAGDALYIAGRKDKTAERFAKMGRLSLAALLQGIDRSEPIILLDHQPYHLDQAAEAGVDLMLSGHTHRGQMAPNHWITGRLFELDWGYRKKGAMHAVVSSGFGWWGPPIRIGSRSEVLDIMLTFEE